MGRTRFRAAAAPIGLAVALAALPLDGLAADCGGAIDRAAPLRSSGFTGDLANTRQAPSGIDSTNVAQLRLALSHVAAGSTEKRGAPAVTEQAVFLSAGRALVAIDRRSGCRYWSYEVPQRTDISLRKNALRSASILYLDARADRPALVLAGDYFGWYYAVDAVHGTPVWSRFVGQDPEYSGITGGAQYYDGKLLVPVATREVLNTIFQLVRLCCSSHGQLQALDPYSGATIWTYDTAPPAQYQPSSRRLAPNGMSIWGTPAVDPVRRQAYVGTGQNLTPPTTDNSDAVVALDLDSGRPKWVFQATAGDAWNAGCEMRPPLNLDCVPPAGPDFDFGAPPILVHLAGGTDAVIAGAKNGIVYSLDPDSGALNWSRRLGRGGGLGGVHWGMAADATRVYVGINDVTLDKTSIFDLGALLTRPPTAPPGEARPGVYALELASGALVWEAHPTHVYEGASVPSYYSAALSVTNDVVFAGSLDGALRAFRAGDGLELWSYDSTQAVTDAAGTQGHGGTIDSVGAIVAGDDVLLNSGYDSFGEAGAEQAGPGNALLIFRLPD